MIEYRAKFHCDKCGKEGKDAPLVLYPDAIDRDDPHTVIENESCEALRESQIDHVYCHDCVIKILAWANNREGKKRGRPKKESDHGFQC